MKFNLLCGFQHDSQITFDGGSRSLAVGTPVRQTDNTASCEGGGRRQWEVRGLGKSEIMWLTLLVFPRQSKPSPMWPLRQVQFLWPWPIYSQRAFLLQPPLSCTQTHKQTMFLSLLIHDRHQLPSNNLINEWWWCFWLVVSSISLSATNIQSRQLLVKSRKQNNELKGELEETVLLQEQSSTSFSVNMMCTNVSYICAVWAISCSIFFPL